MLCLSDMCSSLAVVFFVGAIASWLCAMGVVWVCLAVALGCISLVQFLRYERFRYGTIVRTYAIRHKKVRRAMRKHSASDCDGHEALARDLNRLERLAASLAERARSS